MKRKMFFALLLALLAAALCCAMAQADSLHFVQQPVSGEIDPDTLRFTVTWETSAIPLRVEIVRCDYSEGTGTDILGRPITTTVEHTTRLYTLTADMRTDMSFTFGAKPDTDYRLFAYYGPGEDDYVPSYTFKARTNLLVFSTQPATGSYNPETLQFEAFWVTSFCPTKLEIMKCSKVDKTATWFGGYTYTYTETVKTRVDSMSGLLSLATSYPFEPEPMVDYCVRAYINKDDYIESQEFHATLADLRFTMEPQSVSCDLETLLFYAPWRTTFTPKRVELVREHAETGWSEVTLDLGGASPLFTYPYLEYSYTVERTMRNTGRENVCSFYPASLNDSSETAGYQLWAYYNDDDYISTETFYPNHSAFKFTREPQDTTLDHTDETAKVGWQTNFSPYRVKIVHTTLTSRGVEDEVVSTASYPDRQTSGWRFPAEDRGYWLEAYYGAGESDCVRSRIFRVEDPGHIFTSGPEDAVLPPTQNTWEIEWRTNFTPVETVIYLNPDDENPIVVYYSESGNSASLDISRLESGNYRICARYNVGEWVNTATWDFSMVRTAFTRSPQSCSHLPGHSRQAIWETNFEPERIWLIRVTKEGERVADDHIGATAFWTDVHTADGEDKTQYRIRAWWGDGVNEYVSSEPFWVFQLSYTIQPSDGRAESVDQEVHVYWRTSFVPVGFDFLALRNGSYEPVGSHGPVSTEWDGDGETTLLPNQGGRLSTTYVIRAYAFDGCWVDSEPFTIINPVTFRVFFTKNGVMGTAPGPQDVVWGETAVRPEDATSPGLEFRGWYTEPETLNLYDFSTPVMQATILYAGWTRYVTVRFEGGAHSPDMNYNLPENQTVLTGETAQDPWADGMTLPNNVFLGWTEDYEGNIPFDFTKPVSGDTTIYAQWQPTRCHVTVNANGYGFDRIFTVNIGEPFPQPEVSANMYYTHTGWYTDADCTQPYDFSQPVTGDLELYNGWVENPVVTEMYNDGTDSYNRSWVSYGTLPDLYPPQRTGYSFEGWYLDAACTEPFPADEPLYGDVTIYASWSVESYPVTFDSCGGSAVTGQTVEYNHRIREPEEPTREGFVFWGWYYNDTYTWYCSFHYYDPETGLNNLSNFPVTEPETLYARWMPEGIEISEANFPDQRFRNYISGHYDTDKNGFLSATERDAVTEINLSNTQITDFTGINHFTNVTNVFVYQSFRSDSYVLNGLDVSRLSRLKKLSCYNCNLASLSVAANPELETLLCYGNNFTTLNLSYNTKLVTVCTENCANLSSLSVMGDIRTLKCHGTALTRLDLMGCPGLRAAAGSTPWTYQYGLFYGITLDGVRYELTVNDPDDDGETALVTDGIPVDEEHFPDAGFRAAVRLLADKNGNGYLTSDEREITYLALRGGDICNTVGIAYFPELRELTIPYSMLVELDLSGCPHLWRVNLRGNALTELDVSMLTELTNLDVSENPLLTGLNLGSAPVTSLNVEGCSSLGTLDLSGQPVLLKAWMEGTSESPSDGVVQRSWTSDDGTLSGNVRAESSLNVPAPVWVWNFAEDAVLRLPNGREIEAEVTSTLDMHGRMKVCSAVAVVDGVPFRKNQIAFRVTFLNGTNTPSQWIVSGGMAEQPENPFRAGSAFLGWYTAAEAGSLFNFKLPLTDSVNIHAHWLTPGTENALRLPAGLTAIEAQAFTETSADAVIIPAGVTAIADSAFENSNLQFVFGFPGSAAETFANAHAYLTFIPIDSAWLSSH